MHVKLKPEEFKEGLRFVEDPVDDIFLDYDLKNPDGIDAYMNDGGVMVVWRNDTAVLKARTKKDAADLLSAIPKNSRCKFLVDHKFSSLGRRFNRRNEIFSINYVTKETFKPVENKRYDVVPISENYAAEMARLWPYAGGDVELVKGFIKRWPAYTILEDGNPTSWAAILLKVNGNGLTGLWYTRPEFRGQGRMTHLVSKLAEDTLAQGDFLRADISVDNYPSLGVAKNLGFLQKKTYSRLEPI